MGGRDWVREHPVVTGVILGRTLAGSILGVLVLSEDGSLARCLLGGALAGTGVGCFATVTRMLG